MGTQRGTPNLENYLCMEVRFGARTKAKPVCCKSCMPRPVKFHVPETFNSDWLLVKGFSLSYHNSPCWIQFYNLYMFVIKKP